MSEKMTRINIPGQRDWTGLMDHDEQSAAHMIDQARQYADTLRARAAAIDTAADADFQIDVVRGSFIQHHVRELQRSARLPSEGRTDDR